MTRKRILQIFNRYEKVGGEEGSVTRIGDFLQGDFDVEYFLGSTADLLREGWINRVRIPERVLYNLEIKRRLQHYQKVGRFDLWLVHNVFPALSPVVYRVAESLQIPVVQYLHNYRLSCVNGLFLDHGKPCQRCIQGRFFPAFSAACWRESALASGGMALVLKTMRWQDVFGKISRFIALSQRQKELHIAMGVPEEKIDVVHHFLKPHASPSPNPQGGALFISRLSAEKGGMELLQAWRRLGQIGRRLTIVGDGPERPRLERFCAEHSLENVVFTGFLAPDQQEAIWRDTAFTIVPSIWEEPFGMVVLESWGRQKPVVAHRIGGIPETVQEGKDGWLCDVNEEALASAIAVAFSNPTEILNRGMAGYETLLAQYQQEQWLGKIQSTFSRVW